MTVCSLDLRQTNNNQVFHCVHSNNFYSLRVIREIIFVVAENLLVLVMTDASILFNALDSSMSIDFSAVVWNQNHANRVVIMTETTVKRM